jgi:CubicO group peptidase (beta-lactamase class C family)
VTTDGVVDETYAGVREARGDDPVGLDTLFALASLTKPLVATACLVAVEEGLLELDAPIRNGFTLRHLLSHASGLPERADLLDAPPVDEPGTRRRYSNAGYALAGRLLGEASGLAPATYLHEAVLAPLALDASLGLADANAPRTATVREAGLDAPGQARFNSAAFRHAAGPHDGGYATARAYGGFLAALLRRGDGLLAPETVDEMLSTQFGELPGGVAGVARWDACGWGLGFDVRGRREPHWAGSLISPRSATHFGASGTLAWLDPDRGVGLVALANRGSYAGWGMGPGGWGDLSDAVARAY